MAAKKQWQASIRMIWAIAKSPELHMDEQDVHALVYRETGKDSLKKLSQSEMNDVARILQNLKDGAGGKSRRPPAKRTDEGGNPYTEAQRRKIYALCGVLGWNDNPRRIQGFIKRMTKIDRIEWLNSKQCEKVIEALKKMVERQKKEGEHAAENTQAHDTARES